MSQKALSSCRELLVKKRVKGEISGCSVQHSQGPNHDLLPREGFPARQAQAGTICGGIWWMSHGPVDHEMKVSRGLPWTGQREACQGSLKISDYSTDFYIAVPCQNV